ncbi:NgoPII family restriction endonuclease [Streptococcus salivarius]|jgi:type-2 restriction enzyme ngoPII|uniref:NgoPII family restriction endonuclease n=1 Tax=Streptococcus salivarius TaxID=1304 RepID=A0A6A8UES7_STRSL|nr:NgoPII family restriction endonuclease [Streptococcus salivarius]MCY7055301.1 NgoPII family restriction endonuclease [Streptococcus salivarius]MTQ90566.1 NgoPII family restriction endonuclease [Streptococcus salivarius]MTR28310.1 NgoPII family restriction endonuclease [Streptococcus salivarius]MTR39565.1 NgoPII family restriction endonuclease [Streptococcus salivarius]
MKANILTAVINIVKTRNVSLQEEYVKANRANSMGDALEKYVVDSFANTILEKDETKRNLKINQVFSYLGNDSNPPDAMLKGGAAIETKKIGSRNSQLQLNSSNPKSKLYIDDSRLKKSARKAEDWNEKDFIYSIGFVKENQLKELALIDASIYCADTTVYQDIFEQIKEGISSIPNIDFSPTKELGRVNKIDPLGITSLRIRGMWLLENPFTVFKYVYQPITTANFNLFALVSTEHFDGFNNKDALLSLVDEVATLNIADVKVKNPNNPAKLINCKKITFCL